MKKTNLQNSYNKNLRVALVTESLWSMGGANRVLETFAKMYPKADIYALFGDPKSLSPELQKHKISFSSLNRRLFIKELYRYTYYLWPLHIEKFDLSQYDLVISSSASVAFGVITPMTCKHIAYIHSPMRYLWDLKKLGCESFGGIKGTIRDFLLVFIRLWEVSSSSKPDVLIANSKFVGKRLQKYWGRKPDGILTPPIHFFEDVIKGEDERKGENGDKYIVAGAPFEFNKKGEFLLECLRDSNIVLKLIGSGSKEPRLRRKYSKYKNIQFLGKISDDEKWEILSKASAFVMPGIEDYGIFPVEAVSAGTPVLAYKAGGILENLVEGVNGYFFTEWKQENFNIGLKKVLDEKWSYKKISESVKKNNNTEEMFQRKFKEF
ncbi:glycosyltransferase [Patescibacteria group bacterium]|nr:glycosyltransferase [Patescibacteria group bacterium]